MALRRQLLIGIVLLATVAGCGADGAASPITTAGGGTAEAADAANTAESAETVDTASTGVSNSSAPATTSVAATEATETTEATDSTTVVDSTTSTVTSTVQTSTAPTDPSSTGSARFGWEAHADGAIAVLTAINQRVDTEEVAEAGDDPSCPLPSPPDTKDGEWLAEHQGDLLCIYDDTIGVGTVLGGAVLNTIVEDLADPSDAPAANPYANSRPFQGGTIQSGRFGGAVVTTWESDLVSMVVIDYSDSASFDQEAFIEQHLADFMAATAGWDLANID